MNIRAQIYTDTPNHTGDISHTKTWVYIPQEILCDLIVVRISRWNGFSVSQVDKDFIPSLMYIRDNEATAEEFEAMTLPFTVPSASGQDIQLSSKYSHITLENRAEYVRLAINYRWEKQLKNVHFVTDLFVYLLFFYNIQAPRIWWAGLCCAWGDGANSSSSLAVAFHWLRTGNYG